MPKLNDMIPSKYLKKSDVTTEPVLTISRIEQTNVAQDGKPKEMKWVIYFNEVQKGMVANGTNLKAIARAYGDESDGWIGKRIRLWNDENVTDLKGQLVGGIRVKTPKSAVPPQPAPPPAPADAEFENEDQIPF